MLYKIDVSGWDTFYITENKSGRMLCFGININTDHKELVAYKGLNVFPKIRLHNVHDCLTYASKLFNLLRDDMTLEEFREIVSVIC